MSFLSVAFLVFLAITYTTWRLLAYRAAKPFLCLASFFFYGYWFPPFLLIFLTSGIVDYFVSITIARVRRRKLLLSLSIIVNVGLLAFFKYTDFLIDSMRHLQGAFGIASGLEPLHLILPIGISFYTFQSMSYTIDVYRGKLRPCENLVDFFLYFSFFPHLVAGPIVRAVDFIPQIGKEDAHANRGLSDTDLRFVIYRLARGYFLKAVVADNAALFVDRAFHADPTALSSADAWLGALLFAIQIFGDFAGYSDIAIGTARLFGFRIRENFNNPYFSFGIEEFWRRWHISLTSWFRDYVYIPMGGNRVSPVRTEMNIMFIFLISGLWHGANWTFLIWGFLHGSAVAIEKLLRRAIPVPSATVAAIIAAAALPFTFLVVVILWVPFRSPDLASMLGYWGSMFAPALHPGGLHAHGSELASIALFLGYFLVQVTRERRGESRTRGLLLPEALVYFALVLLMPGPATNFIYFQF